MTVQSGANDEATQQPTTLSTRARDSTSVASAIRFNPRKRAFLAAYCANGGNIRRASEAAQVDRSRHYEWLQTDGEYRAAFESAREMAADALEDEATRRAFEGTEKPVYQQGKEVGKIREYSDTLLMFLLKAQRPTKYRERMALEHSREKELDGEIQQLLFKLLSLEELKDVRDGKRELHEFLPRVAQYNAGLITAY